MTTEAKADIAEKVRGIKAKLKVQNALLLQAKNNLEEAAIRNSKLLNEVKGEIKKQNRFINP